MNQDYPNFQSRVSRISRSRRNRVQGEFVLHDNGILVPKTQRRLRFAFPLKGLIVTFCVAVALKAYLIWFLGAELYQSEVLELLSGSSLEQVAGQILLPDSLSMWLVSQYDRIAELIASYQQAA